MGKKLTPKHEMFVAEYLASFDATKAALAAGYSPKSAKAQGCQLLNHPKIAAQISKKTEKRLNKLEISAERILQEVAQLGMSNILDYVTITEDGQCDINLSKVTREQAAAIQEVTVDATGGRGDGERRLVLRTKFKLAPKTPALELLGKNQRLFTEKIEHSGPEGGPIQASIAVRFVEPDGDGN